MKKPILLGTLLSSLCSNVFASAQLTGEITELWVNDSNFTNHVYISLSKTFVSPCSPVPISYFALDLSEPGMKEAYAMALAAFMSGKQISLAGDGTCKGSYEKLRYISMLKQ